MHMYRVCTNTRGTARPVAWTAKSGGCWTKARQGCTWGSEPWLLPLQWKSLKEGLWHGREEELKLKLCRQTKWSESVHNDKGILWPGLAVGRRAFVSVSTGGCAPWSVARADLHVSACHFLDTEGRTVVWWTSLCLKEQVVCGIFAREHDCNKQTLDGMFAEPSAV